MEAHEKWPKNDSERSSFLSLLSREAVRVQGRQEHTSSAAEECLSKELATVSEFLEKLSLKMATHNSLLNTRFP